MYPIAAKSFFGVVQTRPHEVWARFFGSTLKDDLLYNPTDCFDPFPFPVGVLETSGDREKAEAFLAAAPKTLRDSLERLEQVGKEYYEFRADLMIRNNEGLTKTYNRFHDPSETSRDILKLRDLHAAMDRTVLDAYGWTDLEPTCEFLLDYEDEEDEHEYEGGGRARTRRKPWRYRWPDDFRDEVLARLLELNKKRAEEERLAGLTVGRGSGKAKSKAKETGKPKTTRTKRKTKEDAPERPLFGTD